jgi:TusA-related sulfurtransferase
MAVFKTLDIRGHTFFSAFQKTSKAFHSIKKNGALEIILDRTTLMRTIEWFDYSSRRVRRDLTGNQIRASDSNRP